MVPTPLRSGIRGGQPVTLMDAGAGGQLSVQGFESRTTVTEKLHDLTGVPDPLEPVQVTTVVPNGKTEPLGGVQVMVVPAGSQPGESVGGG